MNHSRQLEQHLLDLGLTSDQLMAQMPVNLTLSVIDGVLSLYDQRNPQSKLNVDFIQGSLSFRSQQHLGAENLIKACQIKGQKQISVLDGTCGLGTDSFLLHQAGFKVTAVENNELTFALLLDGIERFKRYTGENCFALVFADVKDHLDKHCHDVIYLDPMFPSKIKSAKNKKAMQLFQTIHQTETDQADTLLAAALLTSCQRVVIKRPTKSPLLTTYKPTFQIIGKTCRFDAYQLK